MYNKLFIIIIAIASSANICKAQATVLSSYFGSTEEELLELLFEGRKDWCNEVNMKIYIGLEPSFKVEYWSADNPIIIKKIA